MTWGLVINKYPITVLPLIKLSCKCGIVMLSLLLTIFAAAVCCGDLSRRMVRRTTASFPLPSSSSSLYCFFVTCLIVSTESMFPYTSISSLSMLYKITILSRTHSHLGLYIAIQSIFTEYFYFCFFY